MSAIDISKEEAKVLAKEASEYVRVFTRKMTKAEILKELEEVDYFRRRALRQRDNLLREQGIR